MPNFAVRITRSAVDLSGVFVKFGEKCDVLVAYEHPDEGNVHCHIYVENCKVERDMLKNYVRKCIGAVIAEDWSFKTKYDKKTKDVDRNFISYMSKGKYDPVYMSNMDADEIAGYKAKGYDKKAVRLEDGHLIKPIKTGMKKTKRELIEIMLSKINVQTVSTIDLIKGIRAVLVANNEVLGNYKVMDYVDALMMYGDKLRWLNNMMSLYDKRYNR